MAGVDERAAKVFQALRSGTTPLFGRDEERHLLLYHRERAKTGEGCAVLLSGEPGIGKSRLTAALSERIADEPIRACAISARHITRSDGLPATPPSCHTA
jgi:hypothetical protein